MPSRIPSDSNNLGRISAVSCRNPFSRIPIVGYDRNCIQPDRIPARFCQIPTKSDVIRVEIRLKGLLDLGRTKKKIPKRKDFFIEISFLYFLNLFS